MVDGIGSSFGSEQDASPELVMHDAVARRFGHCWATER